MKARQQASPPREIRKDRSLSFFSFFFSFSFILCGRSLFLVWFFFFFFLGGGGGGVGVLSGWLPDKTGNQWEMSSGEGTNHHHSFL